MPPVITIRRAAAHEADVVAEILSEAFAGDPAARWIAPEHT